MYELLRKMKLFAPSSKIQLVYLFRMAKETAELQIIHFSIKRYVLLKPCNKRVRSSAPQIMPIYAVLHSIEIFVNIYRLLDLRFREFLRSILSRYYKVSKFTIRTGYLSE